MARQVCASGTARPERAHGEPAQGSDGARFDAPANCASDTGMTGNRTQQALARIEAALGRIETAIPRAHSAFVAQQARTDHLRRAIGETIRDLDLLISGESGA